MVDRKILVSEAARFIEQQNVTHYFTLTYPRRRGWEGRQKAFLQWVDAIEWLQRRPLGWLRADEMFRFSGLGFPEIPEHHHWACYILTENSGETVAGVSQNLKPWAKGVSGNPGGRPRKQLIDQALQDLLLSNDSALAVAIARKLLARAKKGEVKAIQLVAERVEGKPKRQSETSHSVEGLQAIENMTDQELDQRIRELTEELKLPI